MGGLTVLHVNTERGYRGGEIQNLYLAAGLQDRGHRCVLALQQGSPLADRAAGRGLPVHARRIRGEFDPGAIRWLAGLIGQSRPDVLHYHTSHAVTLGTLACPRRRGPLRVATRRSQVPPRRNPMFRLKFTWRLDHVIAVSGPIRDDLVAAGLGADSVSVVHSGIDLERFEGRQDGTSFRDELDLPPDALLLGCVGALAAEKGHEVLLQALARLKESFPQARLAAIGTGPMMERLQERTRLLGLDGRVRWVGFRDDVAAITPALDIAILPSLAREGSPAVVKEAMAAGVPVVATAIGGIGEIMRDGVEGLLVPPGDGEALAGALGRLLGDPGLRRSLGEAGRLRAREFSMDRMVEQTEAIYLRLRERTP